MRHLRGSGRGVAAPDLGRREGGLLYLIELLVVVGLLAVPVGANFAIHDKAKEPPTPPTYLEPPP